MSDTVRLSVDEGLARITLDRPPLNVFTIEMLGDLTEALSDVAGRDDVRLVRLDAAGKVWTMTGAMSCPSTGQAMTKKSVITLHDRDHHSMEMFFIDPEGNEMKGMEIQYHRKS